MDRILLVGTQFAKQHVESDGFGALGGKFLNEPAINLPRPVKAVMETKPPAFDGGDAGFLHGDKGEVGGGGRGKILGRANTEIVSHPLHPFEEIKLQQADTAYEAEDEYRQNGRCAFERFQVHRIQ